MEASLIPQEDSLLETRPVDCERRSTGKIWTSEALGRYPKAATGSAALEALSRTTRTLDERMPDLSACKPRSAALCPSVLYELLCVC